MGYSPDGAYLGVSSASKKSYCLSTSDYKVISLTDLKDYDINTYRRV